MSLLYTIPWILWFLWFIAWEAWGFKSKNDKWPTLSQIIKWWETPKKIYNEKGLVIGTEPAKERGLSMWTWRRWTIAAGLPLVALVLEAHWVLLWF